MNGTGDKDLDIILDNLGVNVDHLIEYSLLRDFKENLPPLSYRSRPKGVKPVPPTSPLPPTPVESLYTTRQADLDRATAVLKKEAEDFYLQKLKDLQDRNSQLQQQTNEQFALAVQEVEKKFVNVTASPVCQDLQTKVLECYQANASEPLNCSAIVNAFATCVDRARVAASTSRVQAVG